MEFSLVLTIATVAFILVLALVSAARAAKRSWLLAVLRLGVTLLSAVVAVPVALLLSEALSDFAYDTVVPLLPEGLGGFLTEVPVGAEGVRVIAAELAAPFLFLLSFLILRGVLGIVLKILTKILPFLKRKSLRFLAAPLGAANGLVIAVVVLIPLCGFLMLGSSALNTFVDSGLTETDFGREEIMEPLAMSKGDMIYTADMLAEHPVLSLVYGTVGKPVFELLTTAQLDVKETHGTQVEMKLDTELCGLLKTAGFAMEVFDSFEKEHYTVEDKQYLFETADAFFESEWMVLFATDTLVAMSDTWMKGEEFAGMERPSLDATVDPTLNRILVILSSETVDTLEEDIHTIMDVVGDFLIHDLLTDEADYTVMVQKLGASGLLTDMLAKLEQNQRMQPLAAEIKALSMRLVSNMLGVDKLQSGEYDEMMGNVAVTLTDSLSMSESERDALVLESIQSNFGDQGFDVPDDVALEMSHQMIDELGTDGEITREEITDYLVNHADELPMA